MYAGSTTGYYAGVSQYKKGYIDYVPWNQEGGYYSDSIGKGPSLLGYVTHYSTEEVVQYNKGFVDYVNIDSLGYYRDAIQIDLGKLDYVIGSEGYYSDILIDQPGGWTVNWELITKIWNEEDNYIF